MFETAPNPNENDIISPDKFSLLSPEELKQLADINRKQVLEDLSQEEIDTKESLLAKQRGDHLKPLNEAEVTQLTELRTRQFNALKPEDWTPKDIKDLTLLQKRDEIKGRTIEAA